MEVHKTMHDYEDFDHAGYCPVCLDVAMRWLDTPVWATDQCEVWECRCPSCGHIERLAETFLIDDDDLAVLVEFIAQAAEWRLGRGLDD